MNVTQTSSRAYWIDIARILAITLVLEVHSHAIFQHHSFLLPGAAVCLFFYLAGYFNKRKSVYRGTIMFVCACFWILVCNYILAANVSFSLFPPLRAMWFLLRLALLFWITPLFLMLGYKTQCLCVALCGIAYVLFAYFDPLQYPHTGYCVTCFFYFMGCVCQRLPINSLQKYIFGGWLMHRPCLGLALFAGLTLCGVYGVHCNVDCVVRFSPYLLLPGAYALLGMAYFFASTFLRITEKIATLGENVILIYVLHEPVMMLSQWAYRVSGYCAVHYHVELIPKWLPLTIVALIFLYVFVTLFGNLFRGKNKIADILLYARG